MLWGLPQLGVPCLVAPVGWARPCCPSPARVVPVLGWLGAHRAQGALKGDKGWALERSAAREEFDPRLCCLSGSRDELLLIDLSWLEQQQQPGGSLCAPSLPRSCSCPCWGILCCSGLSVPCQTSSSSWGSTPAILGLFAWPLERPGCSTNHFHPEPSFPFLVCAFPSLLKREKNQKCSKDQ